MGNDQGYFDKAREAHEKKDYEKAFAFYIIGAESGDVVCNYGVALFYLKGYFVEKNEDRALTIFKENYPIIKKLADEGDARACFVIYFYYINGFYVNECIPEAIYYLIRAAEIGYARAQYLLAIRYDTGEEIEKNYAKAIYWYAKAAEQGHAEAKKELELKMDQKDESEYSDDDEESEYSDDDEEESDYFKADYEDEDESEYSEEDESEYSEEDESEYSEEDESEYSEEDESDEEYDEDDEYVDYKQCEKFSWGYINYKVNQKTKIFIFKGTYSEFYIVRNGDIIIDNSIAISKKDLYSVQVRKAGLLSSGYIKINGKYIWCGRRRKDDVKDFCEIMKQNGISVEYEDYWD